MRNGVLIDVPWRWSCTRFTNSHPLSGFFLFKSHLSCLLSCNCLTKQNNGRKCNSECRVCVFVHVCGCVSALNVFQATVFLHPLVWNSHQHLGCFCDTKTAFSSSLPSQGVLLSCRFFQTQLSQQACLSNSHLICRVFTWMSQRIVMELDQKEPLWAAGGSFSKAFTALHLSNIVGWFRFLPGAVETAQDSSLFQYNKRTWRGQNVTFLFHFYTYSTFPVGCFWN